MAATRQEMTDAAVLIRYWASRATGPRSTKLLTLASELELGDDINAFEVLTVASTWDPEFGILFTLAKTFAHDDETQVEGNVQL